MITSEDAELLKELHEYFSQNFSSTAWHFTQARSIEIAKRLERLLATPPAIMVPETVVQAVDRMCKPLHPSRLSGVTAEVDARCMTVIRDFIAGLSAAPQKEDGRYGEHTTDVLYDSAWIAGAQFGWNCGVTEDREALNKAIDGRIKDRVELRASLAPSPPASKA